MKFARHLAEEGNEPELHSLYKQLKKSLRIFEGPADAGSAVDVPHTLPSSDEEDEEPGAGPNRALAAAARSAEALHAPAPQQAGATAAGQPAQQSQLQQAQPQQPQPQQALPRRPDPEQEARFVALVEQCVQQVREPQTQLHDLHDRASAPVVTVACGGGLSGRSKRQVLFCGWRMGCKLCARLISPCASAQLPTGS